MSFAASLVLAGLLAAAAGHEQANPLYRALREAGVAVGAKAKAKLPEPALPDGLDARAQQAVLKTLAGRDYAVTDLLENTPVAPYISKIRALTPSDPQAPAYGLDLWFVAYGDLETLTKKEFLESLLRSGRKEARVQVLDRAALAKRGLPAATEGGPEERYTHAVVALLDRVQVSATTRTALSRTPESLLFATQIDPRFTDDQAFPNHWRALTRDNEKSPAGPPYPYDSAASYLKVTRLAEPRGALFVEYHLIYTEPVRWFDGANLLRSKLPTLMQSEVRSFRGRLAKAGPSGD
jgi:hypothetical protein